MSDDARPALKDYRRWLIREQAVNPKYLEVDFYRAYVDMLRAQFADSSLRASILTNLPEWRDAFRAVANADLLVADIKEVNLNVKSYDSFLLKTYRKNISDNALWPSPPDGGWLLPPGWFTATKDIIRTEFSAKYLDSAIFLAERFADLFSADHRKAHVDYEARDSGYYAIHVVTDEVFRVPDASLTFSDSRIMFEIQITTQLQEVLRSLTHPYYERAREGAAPSGTSGRDWQWDYESEQFKPYLIGHVLRHIEGQIMEIRKRNAD